LTQELGDTFKTYRAKWEAAKTFKITPKFPLHVDYELQLECGLKCPMCPNGQKAVKSPLKLSLKTVSDLIKEGVSLGQMALGFGGLWEPLTAPNLPEIVALARDSGIIDAMLNTNGQLLTRAKSQELIKAGLTRLMVSVDAVTPETYQKARPGGDYQLLENNILEFLAARQEAGVKLPILRLSFCVTKYNELELEPFLEKWANKVEFFSAQSYGRFSPKAPALFPQNSLFPAPGGRCAQPNKRLLIRHNGQVTPCCDLSGLELIMGDIKQESLLSVFNGEKIKSLRASLAGAKETWPRICQDCQDKYGS
jgi:radical SAM protein with 4Fe4S-binding SPASM domain